MDQLQLTEEELINAIKAQARSADRWIADWHEYGGKQALNVAFAVGKIFGLYNLLLKLYGDKKSVSDEIITLINFYQSIWSSL